MRDILCKFLKLSPSVSDEEIAAAVEAIIHRTPPEIRLADLTEEAAELESAAKIAAQNGMYESGATLCNRAAGIRRIIEVLTSVTP